MNVPTGPARPSRRTLLRAATLAGFTSGLSDLAAEPQSAESVTAMRFEARESVRLGFIGLGGRGKSLLSNLLSIPGVRVTALCDIVKDRVQEAQAMLQQAGQTPAAAYHSSESAFERLARCDDVDLVVIATPWRWHASIALFAMAQGKHCAVEVPAATTLDECWALVDASEKFRRHCVQLENCCYGQNELMVLNMVRQGLFGELTHATAAYLHDQRDEFFNAGSAGDWRRYEHLMRNGNLYPTHGIGPVSRYMDVNQGDRLSTLVSMSSPARSLSCYRDRHLPPGDRRRDEKYICGDQNVSLIQTAQGRLITLEHNVCTPEPYDRINLIAGTKGIFRDYPPRIFLDGKTKGGAWESPAAYAAAFEHPLWTRLGKLASEHEGHGGMDFLMCFRLIECMRQGLAPDMDVYDAATWSAPGPLSEMSVARGSSPVEFPDFTRGRWKKLREGAAGGSVPV
jgi:predicted dehydrogenase